MTHAERPLGRRISAYILLADPSFLRESLTAYYPYVDRIVLSYDQHALSWTGTPLPVQQCVEIVRQVDTEAKCVKVPGHFFRRDHDPLENDTYQRQHALDAASEDADWVLQLDTDEVMLNPEAFFRSLANAEKAGAEGLDYPARWLYSRVGPARYLERTGPMWRIAASYPGPLAVRPGTRLTIARQCDVPLYRVDFASRNTDPAHSADTVVDEVIPLEHAIMHFSWVRDPELMLRKTGWSGHTEDLTKPHVYRSWVWRTRHPRLAVATSAARRTKWWYRLSEVPEPPGGIPPVVETDFSADPDGNPPRSPA